MPILHSEEQKMLSFFFFFYKKKDMKYGRESLGCKGKELARL